MIQSEYRKRYTEKRMQECFEYLGSVCVVCGTKERLEFDHVDPKTKVLDISTAVRARCWSWDRLVTELDKCQLLCYQHHRVKTLVNGEQGGGQNKITNPSHGTAKMYNQGSCRCDKCTKWRRDYRDKRVHADGSPRYKLA